MIDWDQKEWFLSKLLFSDDTLLVFESAEQLYVDLV